MQNLHKPAKKSIPPSALVIFTDGFDDQQTPVIAPCGGSEEVDCRIIAWFERLLAGARQSRKAA